MTCWQQERGDPWVDNQLVRSLSIQTGSSLMTMIWTLTPPQNHTCRSKSRSFLHRVNDRVRKIQDQSSKDATQDSNKHSLIWWMCMSSTLEASFFMGKNYSENLRSIKKTGNNLTLKQMFDISEKLIVGQSDEIFGVTPINWEDSSWKHLSLVGDEEVISLSHAKVHVFSDFCVMPWKGEPESRIKYCLGRKVDLVQEFITIQNFGHN